MREIQADTLHPNALHNELANDNTVSSNGLLALKDNPHSKTDIEQKSISQDYDVRDGANIYLPVAEISFEGDEKHPGELALNEVQKRTADSIEKSILNGDLDTLQSTVLQFAGRGHELIPSLIKVRRDMLPQEIDVEFWVDFNDQTRVSLSRNMNPYSLDVYSDEPNSARRESIVEKNGAYYRRYDDVDPQTAMKKLSQGDKT